MRHHTDASSRHHPPVYRTTVRRAKHALPRDENVNCQGAESHGGRAERSAFLHEGGWLAAHS